MTINRFNSADNFVMMSKQGLKDDRLSWKAKGILAYMMSLPADWQTHLSEVARHSTDGIDSLRGGFKELEEYGYVRRYQGEKEKGKFAKWITDVSDVPIYKKNSVEEPNNIEPDVVEPDVEIPYADNSTLLSNDNTNNKITNNNNNISAVEETLKNTPNIPNYRILSPKRKSAINARVAEYGLTEVLSAIESIALSDFFRDSYNSKANWYNIEWIFNPNNFLKIIEGRYANRKPTQQQVVSQPAPQKIFDPSQLFVD